MPQPRNQLNGCLDCIGMIQHGCYCAAHGIAPTLTDSQEAAWKLYCQETAGALSAKDFWWELPLDLQAHYLEKVRSQ